jgi:hypothetical protein
VLPVVSSAVFLSVDSSLITAGFGSSEQLLSRDFSFRHEGGEGGHWKREKSEKKRESARSDQTGSMAERDLQIEALSTIEETSVLLA